MRRRVATKLDELARPEAGLFRQSDFRPSDFTVVYAIVATNADRLPGQLPFFSRLNLWHARRFLSSTLDYRVGFSAIGVG